MQKLRIRKIRPRNRIKKILLSSMQVYLNGQALSGSSNGRRLCLFLTSRLASLILTTKPWLIEISWSKKMAHSLAIKLWISMRISWRHISRDFLLRVSYLQCRKFLLPLTEAMIRLTHGSLLFSGVWFLWLRRSIRSMITENLSSSRSTLIKEAKQLQPNNSRIRIESDLLVFLISLNQTSSLSKGYL